MAAFTNAVTALIALAAVTAIIKMVLPDLKSDGVNLVLGLVIVLTIATPLVKIAPNSVAASLNIGRGHAFQKEDYEELLRERILEAARLRIVSELEKLCSDRLFLEPVFISVNLSSDELNSVSVDAIYIETGGGTGDEKAVLSLIDEINNLYRPGDVSVH